MSSNSARNLGCKNKQAKRKVTPKKKATRKPATFKTKARTSIRKKNYCSKYKRCACIPKKASKNSPARCKESISSNSSYTSLSSIETTFSTDTVPEPCSDRRSSCSCSQCNYDECSSCSTYTDSSFTTTTDTNRDTDSQSDSSYSDAQECEHKIREKKG